MEIFRPEAGACLYLATMPVSLNFGFCARVRGPLTLEQLEAALAGVQKRHPLLAVRAAAKPDGTPYFTDEGVPPIEIRVVERVNDDDWVGEVERGVQRPTAYLTDPMIRCVWIRGGDVSDIVLISDHLPSDGRSTVFAIRDLLTLLADPTAALDPILPPPLHELLRPEVEAQILEDTADLPSFDMSDERPPPPADGDEPAPVRPPMPPMDPVRIRPFELSEQETADLIAACRAHGVTVQAALCAAFAMPFAELDSSSSTRRVEVPVDLRPRLSRPVGDAYSNLVGLGMAEFDCSPDRDLWDVARDALASMASLRDRDLFATPLVVINLAGKSPNNGGWIINYDLSISNLGRLDIPDMYGDLRLESIYGPMFPPTAPEHRILGVSTFNGRMRCAFCSRGDAAVPVLARGRELLIQMIG